MGLWIFIIVVAIYVAATGYTDFRMHRIPNYLTVPMALAGLVCSLFQRVLPGYPTSPLDCLAGFALGFAIFFLPFFFGGGGPGDLKLVAALGAWLGWLHLLFALAFSLIFAMFFALVAWANSFSAGNAKARRTAVAGKSDDRHKAARPKPRRRIGVPFSIPMALGTWCILGIWVLEESHPEWFVYPSQNVPAEQQK